MKTISFNLQVNYSAACKCINYMESIGGKGYITPGGSVYTGTQDQIELLLQFMEDNDFLMGSMSVHE
jgi:hypothetical protein